MCFVFIKEPKEVLKIADNIAFYPTVFKGGVGVVFTYSIRLGGLAGTIILSGLYLRLQI